MPSPDSSSNDLLRFARETPFTYGKWQDIKSLYKRLEAEPASSPAALAALISRLDAISLEAVRDIPTANLGLTYNTGSPENNAVNGTKMAIIARGWQASGLYCYDFDTPDPLKPRTIGKITQKGRGDWEEVIFAGKRLLCVRVGNQQIKIFDFPQDGKPSPRGTLPEKSDQTISQSSSASSGFGFLAAAEQMVKSAFGVAPAPVADSVVTLANIQSIAATEDCVFAACRSVSGKKSNSSSGLCVIDISDPDKPQLVGTVAIADAVTVVLVPGEKIAAVLANPDKSGRGNQGSLHLVDVSRPQEPRLLGSMKIIHTHTLTADESHLYIGTPSSGRSPQLGVSIVDITSPQSPRLMGSVPLDGYYTVEHLAYREGFLYASMRYGRIQIIDVRDSTKPVRVRELAPNYIQSLQIVGDRLYSGLHSSIALWSLQIPERPTLLGTPPSSLTLGYMKRRARRFLRNLAKSDPAQFTAIAAKVLSEPVRDSHLDWKTNWILIDLLFGEGGRIEQISHGRGRLVELRPAGLRIRRREERGRSAWNAHPERAAEVWSSSGAPWQAREMVLKTLRASSSEIPMLSADLLRQCLTAPSVLLIAEAVRQAVGWAQSDNALLPDIAAEAFTKALPRQRTLLLSALQNRATKDRGFAQKLTEAILERLANPTDAKPPRRSVSIAMALFEHFAEYVTDAKGNPALRLVPLLLSSEQPLLREQAVNAARRVTPTMAFGWLPQLTLVTDAANQESVLDAMEAAIRGQKIPGDLEDTIRETLLRNQSPTAVWGWRLLDALTPEPDFLRSLWTTLLVDTTLENALETAMALPHALTLLGRSGISDEEMSTYLQERPQLIGLLSAPSFAVLTQSMPAVVTLRMIAAATDDAWTRLREGWLRNLREGIGLNALWTAAEDALKADATGNLERRLLEDPDVAETISDADDIAGILAIREPSFASLLANYVIRHIDKIAASDAFLLTAATHPLREVRTPGLAALEKQRIRMPMALGLMESEVPASIEAGRRWFNKTLEPDLLTRALALCDSPVASVRAIGREFVTAQRENLPMEELSHSLVESSAPQMQAFVARLLGSEPAPDFDREVLRTRNKSREAKEAVKSRQEVLSPNGGAVDTATLLALARGASTPRDSDWALAQLVRRAMAGETIEGLTIEGMATAAAPGEN